MEYPVTPGYTINIVKDRTQPAVLLLSSASANRGPKTYYITVSKEDDSSSENVSLNKKRKYSEEEAVCVRENNTDEFISSEIIVEEDGSYFSEEIIPEITHPPDIEHTIYPIVDNSTSDVYVEHNSDSSGFFTEVAHEEVIEDVNIEESIEKRASSSKFKQVITNVHCDLCDSNFKAAEEAKDHMRHVHNVLTYEGPIFKCEFCGIFVTDRVSHMKVAHYSPLSQAFCKSSNTYKCLQCEYSSDQLTNIRNHVDAKHGTGLNKYLCEECNSEYKTLNSMRAHKSRVHVKKKRLNELLKPSSTSDLQLAKRRHQKLQKEIQELELKTLPTISSRTIYS